MDNKELVKKFEKKKQKLEDQLEEVDAVLGALKDQTKLTDY